MQTRQEYYPTAPLHMDGPWVVEFSGWIGYYLDTALIQQRIGVDIAELVNMLKDICETKEGDLLVRTKCDESDLQIAGAGMVVDSDGVNFATGEFFEADPEDPEDEDSYSNWSDQFQYVTEDEPAFGVTGEFIPRLTTSGVNKLRKLKMRFDVAAKELMVSSRVKEKSNNPLDDYEDEFGSGAGYVQSARQLEHGEACFFTAPEIFAGETTFAIPLDFHNIFG